MEEAAEENSPEFCLDISDLMEDFSCIRSLNGGFGDEVFRVGVVSFCKTLN